MKVLRGRGQFYVRKNTEKVVNANLSGYDNRMCMNIHKKNRVIDPVDLMSESTMLTIQHKGMTKRNLAKRIILITIGAF